VAIWNDIESLAKLARWVPYAFIVLGFALAIGGQYARTVLNDRIDTLKAEAELARKNTPPQVAAWMESDGRGQIQTKIRVENDVPMNAKCWVVTRNDEIISGIMLHPVELHPTPETRLWRHPQSIQEVKIKNGYLELRLEYSSVFSAELGNPTGLKGSIVQAYMYENSQLRPAT
jgi:hypothetical protein